MSPATVSERFSTKVAESHRLATLVEVLVADEPVETIYPTSGSVTLDTRSAIRGRLELSLADEDLIPTATDSLLAPYGNEIRPWRGILYPDGTEELVSLGKYRIDDVSVADAESGVDIRLAALDRAAIVSDASFEEPYEIASGTNFATAILALVEDAYPTVESSFLSTGLATPTLIAEEGEDRWALAQSLAMAIGAILYFDDDGVLVLEPAPDPTNVSADYEIAEGGALISAGTTWNREGSFNRIIVTGESASEDAAPVRAVATDENIASPTYYYGQFGKKPRFFSSSFVTTAEQAAQAADGILAQEKGTTQALSLTSLPDPTVRPNDVVAVERSRLGISENHLIDSVTIPLGPAEPVTAETRVTLVQT